MSNLLVSTLGKGDKSKNVHEDKLKDKIIYKLSEKLFVMSSGGGYTSNLQRSTMKQMNRKDQWNKISKQIHGSKEQILKMFIL